MAYWFTKTGERIPLKVINDRHLNNIEKMIGRLPRFQSFVGDNYLPSLKYEIKTERQRREKMRLHANKPQYLIRYTSAFDPNIEEESIAKSTRSARAILRRIQKERNIMEDYYARSASHQRYVPNASCQIWVYKNRLLLWTTRLDNLAVDTVHL